VYDVLCVGGDAVFVGAECHVCWQDCIVTQLSAQTRHTLAQGIDYCCGCSVKLSDTPSY